MSPTSHTKREATVSPPEPAAKRVKIPKDEQTFVYLIRGIDSRVFTVTMDANAPIHELTKQIYEENAPQLPNVTATTMDVYSTQNMLGGWARLDERGFLADTPPPKSWQLYGPLVPTKRIRHYFSSCIPPVDLGLVHVVVEVPADIPQSCMSEPEVFPSEIPMSDEDEEDEVERMGDLQYAIGLSVGWSMGKHTNFTKKHKYQGAQWIEYGGTRVFIGDKTTWKELYIAANEAIENVKGRVWFSTIENIVWAKDKVTLKMWIGT